MNQRHNPNRRVNPLLRPNETPDILVLFFFILVAILLTTCILQALDLHQLTKERDQAISELNEIRTDKMWKTL